MEALAAILLGARSGGLVMPFRLTALAMVPLFAALASQPRLNGQQVPSNEHEQHHPAASEPTTPGAAGGRAEMMKMMARMKEADSKLEQLVGKMNAAKGAAKTDAMAELLTALVEYRNTCAPMMSMMNQMGGRDRSGASAPVVPQK